MAVEALLWGVIPAVATTGHRLYEVGVLELLDIGIACVMTALVAVNDGLVIQNTAVLCDKRIDRFKHKVDLEAHAHLVGEDLMRERIEDR